MRARCTGGCGDRTKQELRVTLVRRTRDGWRIVHRHTDSQTNTWPPPVFEIFGGQRCEGQPELTRAQRQHRSCLSLAAMRTQS